MEGLRESLGPLIGLGLTLLLVMLRLEAERFHAAEYDEPIRGRKPSLLRRLAWYVLGVAGVLALLLVHPSAERDLYLQVGDRGGILLAFVLGGLGVGQAVALALLHYRRLRFPDVAAYPGALINEILTAFIDEAVFRGAVLGYFMLVTGGEANLAILGSAVVYALCTRLGAPGRDKYMLVLVAPDRPRERLGDAADRWDRRGLPRPRDHPRRRLPHDRPRRPAAGARHGGRGRREAAPHPGGLARRRSDGPARAVNTAPSGEVSRPGAPAPPFGLYVHVPFCVSHCPYCDFVVVAGRAARGPANRIGAFVAGVRAELELRADALDARFGPPGTRPPLETLYLGGGTPSLLPATTLEALIALVRERFGLAPDAEVTLEVNPGAGRARRCRGPAGRGRDPAFGRRAIARARRAADAGPPPCAGRRRRDRPSGPERRHRVDQPRPPLRHPGPDARRLGAHA